MGVDPAEHRIPRFGAASQGRDLPNTVGQYQQAGQLYAGADGVSVRNVPPFPSPREVLHDRESPRS